MPDDQNQNGGNGGDVKQYGTPTNQFQQSGSGTPLDPALQNQWSEVADYAQSTLEFAQQLVDKLNQSKSPLESMARDFQKFRDQLRFSVETADDVSDALKEILSINKKFAVQGIMGLNKRSYAEVRKYLQALYDEQKKLSSKGFFSKDEQRKFDQALRSTGKAISELDDKIKEVGDDLQEIDETTFYKVAKAAKAATSETSRLGDSLDHVTRANKAMGELARLMGGGLYQKLIKATAVSAEFKKVRINMRKEGKKALDQAKADFMKSYGLDKMSPEQIIAWRKTAAGRAAPAVSGRTGLGGKIDKLAERVSDMGDKGVKGWFARRAQGMLEMGGGHVGAGVSMQGLSFASKIGEFTNEFTAAVEIVKSLAETGAKTWDTISDVDMNQQVQKRFGTGGLFATPGQTAGQSLGAFKYNLEGRGMIGGLARSTLKMTTEQNKEIFEQFQDLGLSLNALTQRLQANQMTGVITDRRAQTIGGVEQFAYTRGKRAGFGVGEGAKQNLELLFKFGQTQKQVNELFDRLTIEAKNAGISVTKYLQIVDGITDGFDRFHKSLQAVTATMSVLDSTGIATSEDLKDAMSLYLKGPDKTLEQTAAILQMMPRGQIQQMAQTGQQATAQMRQEAGLALQQKAGLTNEDLTTIAGMEKALQDVAAKPDLDTATKQALSTNIQNLMATQKDLNNVMAYLGGKQSLVDTAANLQHASALFTSLIQMGGLNIVKQKSGLTNQQILTRGTGALGGMLPGVLGTGSFKGLQQFVLPMMAAYMQKLQTKPQIFKGGELQTLYGLAAGEKLVAPKKPGMTEAEMQAALQQAAKGKGQEKLERAIINSDELARIVQSGASDISKDMKTTNDQQSTQLASYEDIADQTTKAMDGLKNAITQLNSQVGDLYTWFVDNLGDRGKESRANQAAIATGKLTSQQMADQASDQMKWDFLTGQGNRWELFKKLMMGQTPTAADFPVGKAAVKGGAMTPTTPAPATTGPTTNIQNNHYNVDASVNPKQTSSVKKADHETAGR